MYGYIYKTTNLINNKIYVGQKHSSRFLGNRYLGSGRRLKDAIRCYGKENFKVELLEEVESKELMDEREIYWIAHYHATNKEIGYNLSEGGNVNRTLVGENNPFYGKHFTQETLQHLSEVRKGKVLRPHTKEEKEHMRKVMRGRIITQEARQKLSNNAKTNPNYGMRGKHCSEETKQKLRLAHLGKSYASKGYMHITNDIEDKMIPKNEFEVYEQQGWRRGRKKFSQQACNNISKGHKGLQVYNKGKIWIHKNCINKFININELEQYLKDDWIRGIYFKNSKYNI